MDIWAGSGVSGKGANKCTPGSKPQITKKTKIKGQTNLTYVLSGHNQTMRAWSGAACYDALSYSYLRRLNCCDWVLLTVGGLCHEGLLVVHTGSGRVAPRPRE